MKTLYLLAEAPALLALARLTLLLWGAWIAHALLRSRHPRWRVGLWRGVLAGSVLLALTPFARLPGWGYSLARAQSRALRRDRRFS